MNLTDRPQTADHDPVHIFLKRTDVFARYHWGRSKGYEMLKSPGFPPAIGAGYRLDTLMAWENRGLAAGGTALAPAAVAPTPSAAKTTPATFPARKRGARRTDTSAVAR